MVTMKYMDEQIRHLKSRVELLFFMLQFTTARISEGIMVAAVASHFDRSQFATSSSSDCSSKKE